MRPEYIFHVSTAIGGEQRVMHPIWKDDLALEYGFEGNQYFRRAGLSGSLTFFGSDYDFISSKSFDTTFYIDILVDYNDSHVNHIIFEGQFYKTDCTFNADDKMCTVKPSVRDQYSKILAGLEKEYDLIKLTPAIQPVTMIRRPMIQVYVPGDSIVTCYLGGMSWEQDAQETDSIFDLVGHNHFGQIGWFYEVKFINPPISTLTDVFVWMGDLYLTDEAMLDNGQGVYGIRTYGYEEYVELRVVAKNDPETILWYYEGEPKTNVTFTSRRQGVSDLTGDIVLTRIFGRMCVAGKTYQGTDAFDIPKDDIVPYNRNYKYCVPYDVTNAIVMSYNYSEQPTEWGMRPDGKYYQKATPVSGTLNYMPVARSVWSYASAWLNITTASEQLEVNGRKDTLLRDAYTIEAVIKALLSQIDNTITFEPTSAYSQFLYGTNPYLNGWGRLVVTPKSNVLVAEYTQPARKAPVTLAKVLNMLRDACGCYWYIDGSNRLRIEHIAWFKNGGSYNTQPVIGIDITAEKNIRNGKPLSFGTNEWSYDKVDMPQRYQYGWMDDTTDTFKGDPIDVLSPFVQDEKVEDINIDGFNSDLDYMMLNPSNVSEDGFALLCCTVTGSGWKTSITSISPLVKVQNWQLAMPVLQPNFLISDMPAWDIEVNGQATTAKDIQRKKKQKITYPCGESFVPDLMKTVRTGLGVGEIEKLNLRLTSRMATINLRFTTV